jgi:hypothetical protein
MNGKVFEASANIFQDQAEILFAYYKEAAEHIIAQEVRYEKEIRALEEKIIHLNANLRANKKGMVICIILFFLVVPAFLAIMFHDKIVRLRNELESCYGQIEEYAKLHKEIFRDYRVAKLGVGYVPVAAQIPFEDKSFLIDYTLSVNNVGFALQMVKRTDEFIETVKVLEDSIQSAPLIETSEATEWVKTDNYSSSIQQVPYHDYFGKIDRSLQKASFCLSDLDTTSVTLPIILPTDRYASFLQEYGTADPGQAPVFKVFDDTPFQDEIERFRDLNNMKKSLERHQAQFEEVLKSLIVNVANSVQAITRLKIASTHLLVDQSNKTLLNILKCSYNHYSPQLEVAEIDRIRNEAFNYQDATEGYQPFQLRPSSRMKYDLAADCWVAEDGSKSNFPFGVHQFHEEIMAPIVQNLMQETRQQRLEIYNAINASKLQYLNEWEREAMDFYGRNRAEVNDLMNIMRATLSDYVAAYNAMNALMNTQDKMQLDSSLDNALVDDMDNDVETFAAFELKSQEFQAIQTDFSEYVDRLGMDIRRRAEKFGYTEYYDASLRDRPFKNYAVAGSKINEFDERRSSLVAINPYFAESAELPPPAIIDDAVDEHMSINLGQAALVALDDLNRART